MYAEFPEGIVGLGQPWLQKIGAIKHCPHFIYTEHQKSIFLTFDPHEQIA